MNATAVQIRSQRLPSRPHHVPVVVGQAIHDDQVLLTFANVAEAHEFILDLRANPIITTSATWPTTAS